MFILASASPRRRALLEQMGCVPGDIIPADIDETPYKHELPRAYALRMAEEKARVVSVQHAGQWILAADTVVACGRRILPKAEHEQEARDCLTLLSGRRHRVYTGISLTRDAQSCHRVIETVVAFKPLSEKDINSYVHSGEWEGKAGGYAIQGLAECFIPFIRGSYSNVVGLPLHETHKLLAGNGVING